MEWIGLCVPALYLLIGWKIGADFNERLNKYVRGDHGPQYRAEIRYALHQEDLTQRQAVIRVTVFWPWIMWARWQFSRKSKR